MDITIRDTRIEELDKVTGILKRSYQQYKEQFPSDAWEVYLKSIIDVRSGLDKSQLIVAEVQKQLAGTVTLYLNGRNSGESWPDGWAAIRLLAVDPHYRRLGVAKALMEECLRRCRQAGIATVGLHTTGIMDIARRMYEKIGFVRAPEFDFFPRPETVVMAYRLELDKRQVVAKP